MTNRNHATSIPAAAEASSGALEDGFELFLSKLSARDRGNVEKHLAGCEAAGDSEHAALWRRLAGGLMLLAEHSAKLLSRGSAQFFKADGKYRMQAFALEDAGNGELSVYCTDVLDRAIAAKLVKPLGKGDESLHYRAGDSDTLLTITRLSGATTDPAPLYKDMLGWNRKAISLTLPTSADRPQVAAVEAIAAMAVTATR